MKFFEVISYLSAAALWIFLIGGWNSVYVQRTIGSFLLARADSIISKRDKMKESLKYWEQQVKL